MARFLVFCSSERTLQGSDSSLGTSSRTSSVHGHSLGSIGCSRDTPRNEELAYCSSPLSARSPPSRLPGTTGYLAFDLLLHAQIVEDLVQQQFGQTGVFGSSHRCWSIVWSMVRRWFGEEFTVWNWNEAIWIFKVKRSKDRRFCDRALFRLQISHCRIQQAN